MSLNMKKTPQKLNCQSARAPINYPCRSKIKGRPKDTSTKYNPNPIQCYKIDIKELPQRENNYRKQPYHLQFFIFQALLFFYNIQATRIMEDLSVNDLYKQASIYQSHGQYIKAIEYYKKCIEMDPNFFSAFKDLGCIYNGDFDDNSNAGTFDVNYFEDKGKAIQCFEKCIQVDPKSSYPYWKLGKLYLGYNQEKGIQYLEKHLQLNPNDPKAIYELGLACQHFKRNQEAILYFKKSIQIDRNNSKAFRQLGITYGETGKLQDAIKSLKKCVLINNGDTQAFACLGRTYNKLGKIPEAIAYYKKCNYLTSYNMEAKEYLKKHGEGYK